MPDFSTMRLGKRPATRDMRTLKLADYLDLSALPPIPDTFDYGAAVAQWPMFLNDQLGDCVPAAMGHQTEADSAMNGAEAAITDADVLTAYEQIGGYNPAVPGSDQGCDPLRALKAWQKTGIAGHTIGAFAQVDPHNDALVKAAAYLFGGLFLGVELPLSAQHQSVWDVPPGGPSGNGAPGSWGGHMIYVPTRLAGNLWRCVTWGQLLPLTPAFIATYSPQETFAVIANDWLNGQKVAPNGLDIAALTRDLQIVQGLPDPGPPPFVPSEYLMQWTLWQEQATHYVTVHYASGDQAGAVSEQQVIAQHAAWLGQALAGQTSERRPVPPAPGGGA